MPAAARGAARRACLAPRGAGAWHRGDGASPRGRRHAHARGSAAQWPSAPCRVELEMCVRERVLSKKWYLLCSEKNSGYSTCAPKYLKLPTRCFSHKTCFCKSSSMIETVIFGGSANRRQGSRRLKARNNSIFVVQQAPPVCGPRWCWRSPPPVRAQQPPRTRTRATTSRTQRPAARAALVSGRT